MSLQIAIQGIEGSYHEMAARQFFNDDEIEIIECPNFTDVIETVKQYPTVLGILAIENTIAGSLLLNHELIRKSQLTVVGEYKLRISHCLAVLPETKLSDIKWIASHPIALRQCDHFLDEKLPDVGVLERNDTASSARWIAKEKLADHAAICSREAAWNNDLEVLVEGIETNSRNFTRFLIVAEKEASKRFSKDNRQNKASIVFSLPHSVGSLSKILTILSFYEMNLTKIQSFPVVGAEWQYLFYVDFTFSDYFVYQRAIDAVLPLIQDLRILGEYQEQEQTA